LLKEMLAASQITRDLSRQRSKKLIRSAIFDGLPYPPTPAFDLFALTTNLTRPHDNAELKGLVRHDKLSDEGQRFSRLRKHVLQPGPEDPPPIVDLHGLCVELGLDSPRPTAAPPAPTKPSAAPVVLSGPSMPPRGRATPQPEAPTRRVDADPDAGAA
ncbi:MAG: hypothetical protein AAGL98_04545, partial [Planctomycetota bacterium]